MRALIQPGYLGQEFCSLFMIAKSHVRRRYLFTCAALHNLSRLTKKLTSLLGITGFPPDKIEYRKQRFGGNIPRYALQEHSSPREYFLSFAVCPSYAFA
ncbi:MAG: hypothetical protein MJA29_11755 [Candidatus Omnitrophica bacterium]|nr:hypothetical protein [Candidatus Omnitrophota bacterium]